jgi:predicted transposase YdaD
MARNLVARAKAEIEDESLRKDLIELIETIIIYKLARLSREEVQTMLQVHDIRETRVYQEAKEEGLKEGKEEGLKEGKEEGLKEGKEEGLIEGEEKGIAKAAAIVKLAAGNKSVEEIAAILNLKPESVRQVLAQFNRN